MHAASSGDKKTPGQVFRNVEYHHRTEKQKTNQSGYLGSRQAEGAVVMRCLLTEHKPWGQFPCWLATHSQTRKREGN